MIVGVSLAQAGNLSQQINEKEIGSLNLGWELDTHSDPWNPVIQTVS